MGHLRRLPWPHLNLVLLRRFVAGFAVVFVLGAVLASGGDSGSGTSARAPTASPGDGSGGEGSGVGTFAVLAAVALVVLLAAVLLLRRARQRRPATTEPSSPSSDGRRREIPYGLQLGSTALGMLSAAATVVQTFRH